MFNFFKPKIVQFKDGQYALRKKIRGKYVFFDLVSLSGLWWENNSMYSHHCKTKDKSLIDKHIKKVNLYTLSQIPDYGTPVK